MNYVLYVDVMLVWSSVINIVVLSLASIILGMHIKMARIIIWGIITGSITVIECILMMGGNKILHYILYVAIYIIMTTSFFTFRTFSGMVKVILAVIVAMIATYGIVGLIEDKKGGLPVKLALLVLYLSLIIYICWNLDKNRCYENNIYNVSVMTENKCVRCKGYIDSGNMLYDISTTYPVVIISCRLAKRLLGEIPSDIWDKYSGNGIFDYEKVRGASQMSFFPIPYKTVSENVAFIPGFKLKLLCITDINGLYKNIIAAISRVSFGNGDFDILLHSSMNKIREENSND